MVTLSTVCSQSCQLLFTAITSWQQLQESIVQQQTQNKTTQAGHAEMPMMCECCLHKISAHEAYYEADYDLCETCFLKPQYHYDQRHWYLAQCTRSQERFCNGCLCSLKTSSTCLFYLPNCVQCTQCHANGKLRDLKWAAGMGYAERFTFQTFRLAKLTNYMLPQQVRTA